MVLAVGALSALAAGSALGAKPAKPGRYACSVKAFRLLLNPDAGAAGLVDARSEGLVGTDPAESVSERCAKSKLKPSVGRAAKSQTGFTLLSCKSPRPIHVSVSTVRKGGRTVASLLVVTAGAASAPIATAEVALTRNGTSTTTWDAKRCELLSGTEEPEETS